MLQFYSENDPNFGYLSNLFCKKHMKQFNLEIDGKKWNSVEHYFQAQKFLGTDNTDYIEYADLIQKASTPYIAKILASQKITGGYTWRVKLNTIIQKYKEKGVSIRPDWDIIKNDVMLKAVYAKFQQNTTLKDKLILTGDDILIEHTTRDSYWGDGGDGSGENKLGNILMRVRAMLITNS